MSIKVNLPIHNIPEEESLKDNSPNPSNPGVEAEKENPPYPPFSKGGYYREIILNNLWFVLPYALFLLFGSVMFLIFPKGELEIWLNGFHNDYLDRFFAVITNLGDGLFYVFIVLLLLFYRIKYSITGFISFILTGLGAQILKRIFDTPRPKVFFRNDVILHYVPYIDVYSAHSFPSGHSVSAFSLFLFLSIITKNKSLGLLFFLCALIIGISRVYLLQHFFIDIYFGSIVGVFLTILIYTFIENSYKFRNSGWYDLPLQKFIRKNRD
jgi:membrane-associated phospholipid phosphatase